MAAPKPALGPLAHDVSNPLNADTPTSARRIPAPRPGCTPRSRRRRRCPQGHGRRAPRPRSARTTTALRRATEVWAIVRFCETVGTQVDAADLGEHLRRLARHGEPGAGVAARHRDKSPRHPRSDTPARGGKPRALSGRVRQEHDLARREHEAERAVGLRKARFGNPLERDAARRIAGTVPRPLKPSRGRGSGRRCRAVAAAPSWSGRRRSLRQAKRPRRAPSASSAR